MRLPRQREPEHPTRQLARANGRPAREKRKGRTHDPIISPSAEGFGDALIMVNSDLRYNVRSAKYEICLNFLNNSNPWEHATERCFAYLFEKIAERCRFPDGNNTKPARFSQTLRKQVVNAYGYEHEVDPFESWLSGLPERDIGTTLPWLEFALGEVFDIRPGQNERLVQWISSSLLLTTVWRCKHPGYKQDVVPVLIGGQGIGKSTCLRALLPDDRDEWFGDGLSLSSDDKTRVEATQGRVIVEISEMSGSTRADQEQMKAYISRRDDGNVRMAYRSDPEPMPRRFALVATSNDRSCLPSDPSGLRRFAPVEIDAMKDAEGKRRPARYVHDWIAENRRELWAEAVALYKAGEKPTMPFDLEMGAASEQAERFRNSDEVVEEKLRDWLSGRRDPFPLKDALVAVGFDSAAPPTGGAAKRVARALQQHGCEKTKVEGARVWLPPEPRTD